MKKKRVLTEEEKQNDTYCKIVATVLGIPFTEPQEGFAETNFQTPDDEEVHLKGIIHDYSDGDFRLFIHGSSGKCFLIAEKPEVRKYMILKLEACTWSCPMDMLQKNLSEIRGAGLAEAALSICKIFQDKYRYFGRYHEHDYVWAFDKFIRHLIPVNRRYEMIYEAQATLSAPQVLSTYDSTFEKKVKMDGKTYTVFDATDK